MDFENGMVQRAEGPWAWVLTRRGGSCGGCGHKSHCEIVEGGDLMLVKALNRDHAAVGEEVRIALPGGVRMKSYVLAYFLPILGLVGGALLGNGVAPGLGWSQDAAAIFFAMISMGILFLIARMVDRRIKGSEGGAPVAIKIHSVREEGTSPHRPPDTPPRSCCS
ncbi:MAG: SoxR reducing system RseC family protein [Deltaproteobacteria bacterium]|nr:SoxR reducing system RseC family protein [Deltaproteobacteria bacterium]MBW1951100.1 SoxR reducing system RseC family protein [Deltaproteobacteria bacterium]MBW2009598.1 SoxR reducing system RseC family protein [Deltaproteobacteria bacterium]MBW2101913.1 SoxR reducing system RseC family protein [Deltaproteobacteria bacterium]MBW2349157.1 SoxR reducing system RseC family protein [Deltaproteobacteria bacterium]